MSLDQFKTIMDPHASREDRIAVLASETDIATGIIDNETDCDKGYFENQGPGENTGTAYAALCDLLDMVHGRVTGQTLDMAGVFQANASGQVGIGGAPSVVPTVLNLITGKTWIDGDVGLSSGLAVDGTTELSNTVLNTVNGEWVRFKYTDIDFYEQQIASRLDEVIDLMHFDDNGNFILNIRGTAAEAEALAVANGGTPGYDGQACLNFRIYSEDLDKPVFNIHSEGGATFGPKDMEIGDSFSQGTRFNLYRDIDNNGPGSYFYMINESSTPYQSFAMLHEYDGDYSSWTMSHDCTSVYPGTLNFGVKASSGGSVDNILILSSDYAKVVCDTGGQGYFSVWSNDDYQVKISTKLSGITNRNNGSGTPINPGVMIGSGRSNFVGRLAFDSWHEYNSIRLFVEDFSGASCVPTVALGQPLGTNSAPIDALVAMNTPFGAGVGVDHRLLYGSHASKDGFHVGVGEGDNAMVWLWGTSGYWPGINMGVDRGSSGSILYANDEGCLMVVPGDTAPASLGTDAGDHCIPVHVTTETHSTGDSDIALELIGAAGGNFPGSALLIIDDAGDGALWVADGESDAANNWHIFAATRTQSMS